MSKRIIILFAFVTLVGTVRAAEIRNQINIETNTGGNTVNDETDGAQVQTGDTTTKININNSNQTDSTTKTETKTSTNVEIESTGGGTSTVEMNINGQKYSFIKENGVAKVTTTNSAGEVETQEIGANEAVELDLGDIHISIDTTDNGFTLTQDNTQVVTSLPLSVDTTTNQLTATIDNTDEVITLFPSQLRGYLAAEDIINTVDSPIELVTIDGILKYQLTGQKTKRLFGIFPISVHQQVQVSATGETSHQTTISNPIQNLLNTLSI